jgi:pimeloyl-ACP methyl ester carboxylesterase/predicted glycosyltransferase
VVVRDHVRIAYEVFGDGDPTIVLLPTWSIVHSRFWKAQVPYLARHFRVVTFDGRGCGLSGRPAGGGAYSQHEFAADTVSVLDATGTASAVLVGFSCGALWGLQVAADHPDRTRGLVAVSPAVPLAAGRAERRASNLAFEQPVDEHEGWAKYNRQYWLSGGYDDFLQFFFSRLFIEPHSTKQIEDCVRWGRQTDPETLADAHAGIARLTADDVRAVGRRVRAPVLVVHGDADAVRPHGQGAALADLTGGALVTVGGGGHGLPARQPVLVNSLIRDFVHTVHPAPRHRTWTRAGRRSQRALYLSSPIGLGHARRDVAIAAELRALHPDLQIDWLAQHPVTRVLEAAGENIHPASAWLANESAHIEDEADEHDLHAFEAIRRMDETLVSNFMVFSDVVAEEHYDLVIADEAWDVDYFLHENPELKRFAFAWMTDFVGWLPMPDGGAREAALTADYNAEMIEQRARFSPLRDRSIFVGNPGDVVDASFGPGLPSIRSWTQDNFDFSGYVTGLGPVADADREQLRAELGYSADELVCVVTVGGSGVGTHLLRRALDAVPAARRLVPGLRFEVVTGPRIDRASLPRRRGVRMHGYLPDLYRRLAACDLAVVQGGLTTCMELTAGRTPFIYVPLRHHFEQNHHVRHRLAQYEAGTCLEYAQASDPDVLAEAIAKEVTREVAYRPVETDGAARAAAMLADVL